MLKLRNFTNLKIMYTLITICNLLYVIKAMISTLASRTMVWESSMIEFGSRTIQSITDLCTRAMTMISELTIVELRWGLWWRAIKYVYENKDYNSRATNCRLGILDYNSKASNGSMGSRTINRFGIKKNNRRTIRNY